jgi:hypothetical protein
MDTASRVERYITLRVKLVSDNDIGSQVHRGSLERWLEHLLADSGASWTRDGLTYVLSDAQVVGRLGGSPPGRACPAVPWT